MLKKMYGKHVEWVFDYYVLERSTSNYFMEEVKYHIEHDPVQDIKVTQNQRFVRIVILTRNLVRELMYDVVERSFSNEAVTRSAIELLLEPNIFNYKDNRKNIPTIDK